MTTSESKGRFFYKTNRFAQRIESIRIANWNALLNVWQAGVNLHGDLILNGLQWADSQHFPLFLMFQHASYTYWQKKNRNNKSVMDKISSGTSSSSCVYIKSHSWRDKHQLHHQQSVVETSCHLTSTEDKSRQCATSFALHHRDTNQ